MFDNHRNFAESFVSIAPADPLEGTSFELLPGDGEKFAANMPVTLSPPDEEATYDNAEIGYVTAIDGDELTILRGQEETVKKSVGPGWRVSGTLTRKTLEDIEAQSDKTFSQPFTITDTVTVEHNLGKYPSVTIIDSAGDEVVGLPKHLSENELTISFSAPFSGVVYLN